MEAKRDKKIERARDRQSKRETEQKRDRAKDFVEQREKRVKERNCR